MLGPCSRAGFCKLDPCAKNKNVVSIAQNNVFVFLYVHRSVLKGWQLAHVHGQTTDFVSRSMSCGGPSPVNTQSDESNCLYPKVRCRSVLAELAFPPPPLTFPATRPIDPHTAE